MNRADHDPGPMIIKSPPPRQAKLYTETMRRINQAKQSGHITGQEHRTLRGQAQSGDVLAALRGLTTLLARSGK